MEWVIVLLLMFIVWYAYGAVYKSRCCTWCGEYLVGTRGLHACKK